MNSLKDSKNLNSTAIMALILAYHFNSSDIDDDSLEHKSQKLKANHVSCEGGTFNEKMTILMNTKEKNN